MRNKLTYCLLAFQLVVFCGFALAQPSKPVEALYQDKAVLQELLAEVRQLRKVLEQSIAVGARTQVLLQRMQLQNQRVMQASQRLDELRKLVAKLLSDQASYTETLRQLQEQSGKESDLIRRQAIEREIEQGKALLDRFTRTEPQLRAQESEADAAFRKEQAVWDELSEQLASLEHLLSLTPTPPSQTVRP